MNENDPTKQLAVLLKQQNQLIQELQKTIASREPRTEFQYGVDMAGKRRDAQSTFPKAETVLQNFATTATMQAVFGAKMNPSEVSLNFGVYQSTAPNVGSIRRLLKVEFSNTQDFIDAPYDFILPKPGIIINYANATPANVNANSWFFARTFRVNYRWLRVTMGTFNTNGVSTFTGPQGDGNWSGWTPCMVTFYGE